MVKSHMGKSCFRRQASILRPVGYGPTTLPLSHSEL